MAYAQYQHASKRVRVLRTLSYFINKDAYDALKHFSLSSDKHGDYFNVTAKNEKEEVVLASLHRSLIHGPEDEKKWIENINNHFADFVEVAKHHEKQLRD